YYRLSVIEISLPPLRHRTAEIEPLVERLLMQTSLRHGLAVRTVSPEAFAALVHHEWPGNVRELRNRLERASVLAREDVLEPEDIFPELSLGTAEPDTLADVRRQAESERIDRALIE